MSSRLMSYLWLAMAIGYAAADIFGHYRVSTTSLGVMGCVILQRLWMLGDAE